MQEYTEFVSDERIQLFGIVHEKKDNEVFGDFFKNDFKRSIRVKNSKNLTICVKFENYSVFHLKFSQISLKVVINKIIDNPTTDTTNSYKKFVSLKKYQGKRKFLGVNGEGINFKNGDVLIIWTDRIFYKTGDKFYEASITDESILLEDSSNICREEICELTGVHNEF